LLFDLGIFGSRFGDVLKGLQKGPLQLLKADKLGDDVGDLVARLAILTATTRELVQRTHQRLAGFAMSGVIVSRIGVDDAR
jgi:hypothetical protein